MLLRYALERLVNLHEATGHMEASLPLATLEGKQHFALTVQIAEPFGMLGIHEVAPHIVVYALEPCQTLGVAGQFVALDHGDESLDVYPPQLLVPLQLLERTSKTVHEVEDTAILLVPTILCLSQGYLHSLLYKCLVAQTLSEIHDEPHGFDGMTGIEQTAVHAIHKFVVRAKMLDNKSKFGTVEDVHHLVHTGLYGLVQEVLVEQGLNLQSHVAQNHGQCKTLQRACAWSRLGPTALGVIHLGEDDIKCLLGYIGILLVAGGDGQLAEGYDGKGIGENVVGLHQRVSLAVKGKVPVEVAVVTVLLQELGTLYGGIQPFLTLLYLII